MGHDIARTSAICWLVYLIIVAWSHHWPSPLLFMVFGMGFIYHLHLIDQKNINRKNIHRIVKFSIDTRSLVEFYLTKRAPIEAEYSKKVSDAINKDPNFVSYIHIKMEFFGDEHALRVKCWDTRSGRTEYTESDLFGDWDMGLWWFSLPDYLDKEEYKRIAPKSDKVCDWESIKIELEDGVVQIYGDDGRFGETKDEFREITLKVNKPENFLLKLDQGWLSKIKFTEEKTGEEFYQGCIYRQNKHCREWAVYDDCVAINHNGSVVLFPGHWSYSVREL